MILLSTLLILSATSSSYGYSNVASLHNHSPFTRRRTIRSYFDDVSRYQAKAWHPEDIQTTLTLPPPEEEETLLLKKQRSEEVQSLTNAEIRAQIEYWSTDEASNLIGSSDAHEREHIAKIQICRCTTLPACMAALWSEIQSTVRENTYLYDGSWKVSSIDEETGKVRRGSLILVAMPFCEQLYDYTMFKKFHAAMDFTRDQTRYFGHTFGLTHYHPHFSLDCTYNNNTVADKATNVTTVSESAATARNDPSTSKSRTSPYPVFALTIGGAFDNEEELAVLRSIGIQQPEARLSEQADWLRNARADLTIIYNRAAGSGVDDVINKRGGNSASRARRNYSAKFTRPEIRQMCERWIEENEETSNALKYAQSIDDWFICAEPRAEDVYADIWRVIGEVYARGKLIQNKRPQKRPLHGNSWLEQFGNLIGKGEQQSNCKCDTTTSTVFISTKFCAFNSEGFKKFAITINAALKRLTDGKMFLEIFHPEYVGKKGYNNSFRRAPYAMLMLCYDSTRKDDATSTSPASKIDGSTNNSATI